VAEKAGSWLRTNNNARGYLLKEEILTAENAGIKRVKVNSHLTRADRGIELWIRKV
jgi:hypothetical protein